MMKHYCSRSKRVDKAFMSCTETPQKGREKDKLFHFGWVEEERRESERNKTSLRCVVIGMQESSKVPIPSYYSSKRSFMILSSNCYVFCYLTFLISRHCECVEHLSDSFGWWNLHFSNVSVIHIRLGEIYHVNNYLNSNCNKRI